MVLKYQNIPQMGTSGLVGKVWNCFYQVLGMGGVNLYLGILVTSLYFTSYFDIDYC